MRAVDLGRLDDAVREWLLEAVADDAAPTLLADGDRVVGMIQNQHQADQLLLSRFVARLNAEE